MGEELFGRAVVLVWWFEYREVGFYPGNQGASELGRRRGAEVTSAYGHRSTTTLVCVKNFDRVVSVGMEIAEETIAPTAEWEGRLGWATPTFIPMLPASAS